MVKIYIFCEFDVRFLDLKANKVIKVNAHQNLNLFESVYLNINHIFFLTCSINK